MKRVQLVLLLFCLFLANSYAQFAGDTDFFKTAASVGGYWSKWDMHYTYLDDYEITGYYRSIVLYKKGQHPSKFFFKFTIDSSQKQPDRKEIKKHYKTNTYYEYKGTAEYYRTDQYPTAESQLSKNNIFVVGPPQPGEKKPVVKQVSEAKIIILPYKETPRVYNIFFDGIGFGIDLQYKTFSSW